ncbi:hypothetical protein C8Q77DRAFT_895419 [Trametes polyzona]|nr:hypothetical protein C8Q77DRAFT_895419 [Trametes polyzona]
MMLSFDYRLIEPLSSELTPRFWFVIYTSISSMLVSGQSGLCLRIIASEAVTGQAGSRFVRFAVMDTHAETPRLRDWGGSLALSASTAEQICAGVHPAAEASLYHPNPRVELKPHESATDIKDILQDFLSRMKFVHPGTVPDKRLRCEVAAEVYTLGDANIPPKFLAAMIDTGCSIAECAYGHTSYENRRHVALHSAYVLYVDDLGHRNPASLSGFGRRFVAHENPGDSVLDRIVRQSLEMYALYPPLGADSIIAAIITAIAGCHVENSTRGMSVASGASSYPSFIRGMTGYATAYTFFNFTRGWRDPDDLSYLQVIPDLVMLTNNINDILSFYKELIAGETGTYVCLRAGAEQKDTLAVLQELCKETLVALDRVARLTAVDLHLKRICERYLMGFVEFHLRANRYLLDELKLELPCRGV